jgi:predicted nuclease with TOPRIM domain
MSGLREYIEKRKSELHDEEAPLVARRDELQAELDSVLAKLKTLEEEWNQLARAGRAIGMNIKKVEETQEEESPLTIKQAVLHLLSQHPDGLTAFEIRKELNVLFFNGRIKRESLSPQLTRLKDDDHKLTLRGGRWYIRQ